MDEVQAVVSQARLGGFLAGLRSLGVEEPADLLDLTSEDLESVGMNRLQRRRFDRQVVAAVRELSVAPQPASAAAQPAGSGFAAQRRARPHPDARPVTDSTAPVMHVGTGADPERNTQQSGSGGHVFDAAAADGMSSTRALRTLLSSPAGATHSAPAKTARSGVSWALDQARTPAASQDASSSGGAGAGAGAGGGGGQGGGPARGAPSPDVAYIGDASDNDADESAAPTDTSRGTGTATRSSMPRGAEESTAGGGASDGSTSLGDESVVVVDPDAPPVLPSSFGTQQPVVKSLPEPEWQEVQDANGYLYYHHKPTGKVQWEVPPATYASVAGGVVTPPAAVPSLLPDRTHVEELAVKEMLESSGAPGQAGGYLNRHRQMGSTQRHVSPTHHRAGSPTRLHRRRVGSPARRPQPHTAQGAPLVAADTPPWGLGLDGVRPVPVNTAASATGTAVFEDTPQNGGATSRLTATTLTSAKPRSAKRTPRKGRKGKGKASVKGHAKAKPPSPREAWNNSARPAHRRGNPLAGTATRKVGYDLERNGTEQGRWRSTWQEVVKISSAGGSRGGDADGPAVSDGSDAGEGPQRPAAAPGSTKRPARAAPRLARTYSGRKLAPTATRAPAAGTGEDAGDGSGQLARTSRRLKWTDSLRGDALKAAEAPKPHSTREAYLAMLAEAKAIDEANAAAAARARSERDGSSSGQRTPTSRASKGKPRRRRKPTVFDRLTDVRSFTGTHRERFDTSTGRGKGLAGRERLEMDMDELERELPTTPLPLPVDGPFQAKSMRYFKF